jgi:S-adenosylmethionine:diacylglycerol 3-amino-3-carboxypropyl transferase
MENNRGTLAIGEPHPAAFYARQYLASLSFEELSIYQESFASCAIEGNRMAEICSETLNRLLTGLPVSDRYILGLAWAIRDIKNG